MTSDALRADLVLSGGGVKGIGLAGAVGQDLLTTGDWDEYRRRYREPR